MEFIIRYAYITVPVFIYVSSFFRSEDLNSSVMILSFLVGFIISMLSKLEADIKCNRIMQLTLYKALTSERIDGHSLLTLRNILHSQNAIRGETGNDDFEKLKKVLQRNNISIEDWFDDENISVEDMKKMNYKDYTLFGQFVGFTDKFEVKSTEKLNLNKDRDLE